jgi:hypothetical protein
LTQKPVKFHAVMRKIGKNYTNNFTKNKLH